MDDAAAMGVAERFEHPLDGDEGLLGADRHPLAQRPALDVLHRDVRDALVLEDVEDEDDARVRQRAGELRLADEALDGLGRRVELDALEGDRPAEARVVAEEHHAAAAAPERVTFEDLVTHRWCVLTRNAPQNTLVRVRTRVGRSGASWAGRAPQP